MCCGILRFNLPCRIVVWWRRSQRRQPSALGLKIWKIPQFLVILKREHRGWYPHSIHSIAICCTENEVLKNRMGRWMGSGVQVPSECLGLSESYWRRFPQNAGAVFFHILGMVIPTDELIFFRGVGIPPSRFFFGEIEVSAIECLSNYIWFIVSCRARICAPQELSVRVTGWEAIVLVSSKQQPKEAQGMPYNMCLEFFEIRGVTANTHPFAYRCIKFVEIHSWILPYFTNIYCRVRLPTVYFPGILIASYLRSEGGRHGQPLLRGGYSLGHRTMLDQRSNSAEPQVDPRDEFSQDMVYHGVYILGV